VSKNIIATCVFAMFCSFLMVLMPMIGDGLDEVCVYRSYDDTLMDTEIRRSGYKFPLLCENKDVIGLFTIGALAVGGAVGSFMLGRKHITPFQRKREMLGSVGLLIALCIIVNVTIKETLPEMTPVVFFFSFLNLLFVQLGAYEKVMENKQVFNLILFSLIVFIFLVLFLLLLLSRVF